MLVAPELDAEQTATILAARSRMNQVLFDYGTTPENFSLIHADLLPQNVLVSKGQPFVIDFDDPDGNNLRYLTDSWQDEAPTWAPNGRYLMFFRDQPGAAGARIYMVDTTGRVENTVPTQNFSSDPAWSPLLK